MAFDSTPQHGVREVLGRLDALTDRRSVAVRDVVDAFGSDGYLAVMMVPALVVLSPLSGIPLLPSAFGLMIFLIAGQAMFGRNRIWLPGFLMRREIRGGRLHTAIGRLQRTADWLDTHARDRLGLLVHRPFSTMAQLLCALSGGMMPFLELVPFSSSILAAAVLLFATSLLLRDGLYAALGSAVFIIGASVPLLVYGGLIGLGD